MALQATQWRTRDQRSHLSAPPRGISQEQRKQRSRVRKSDAVAQVPLLEVSRESDAAAQLLPAAKLGENFSKYSSPFNW